MMQCVSLSTPKKAAQHTALFACDGVHQCVMLWWVVCECERELCYGGVVDAGEKGKSETTQQHQHTD